MVLYQQNGCNVSKTKFIIVHTHGKKVDLDGKKIIFDNNDPSSPFDPNLACELERVHNNHTDPSSRSYKLLGILLDEHLTFHHHIDYLKSKLSWARVPAGPSRDACPRSCISSARSALPRAFSKLFFCIPRFAFLRSKFCNAFQFRML